MAAVSAFFGTYTCKVDSEDRVAVPVRFRDLIPEGPSGRELFLIPGSFGCIEAYPRDRWQDISSRLSSGPGKSRSQRALATLLYANGANAVPDTQGRVKLTPQLKVYSGITSECLVVGGNDHIKIWSPERWAEFEAKHMPSLDDLLDSIAEGEQHREG